MVFIDVIHFSNRFPELILYPIFGFVTQKTVLTARFKHQLPNVRLLTIKTLHTTNF